MEGIRSVSHLSTRVMERLLVEIPEAKIVSGIKDMLNASYVTKSGKEHPDYRAREAGVRLYLAYTVGLPLQRQVVSSVTPPQSGEETMARTSDNVAGQLMSRLSSDHRSLSPRSSPC